MMTMSSPAIRDRQAKAQPCLRPATRPGEGGGQDDEAVGVEAPGAEHPAGPQQHRRDVVDTGDHAVGDGRGGAEDDDEGDGAPRSAVNSRTASGSQAIVGIVWRPVIIDPKAARRILLRATASPRSTPMTTEMA